MKRIGIATAVTGFFGLCFYLFATDSVTVFNDSGRRVVAGTLEVAGHSFQIGSIRAGGSTAFRYWPRDTSDCVVTLRFAGGRSLRASTGLVDARMFGDSMRVVVKAPDYMTFIAGW